MRQIKSADIKAPADVVDVFYFRIVFVDIRFCLQKRFVCEKVIAIFIGKDPQNHVQNDFYDIFRYFIVIMQFIFSFGNQLGKIKFKDIRVVACMDQRGYLKKGTYNFHGRLKLQEDDSFKLFITGDLKQEKYKNE